MWCRGSCVVRGRRCGARDGGGMNLTDSELAVVRAVARGLSNDEIATQLRISLSTAKAHLAGAQRKLGVRNRVEAAAWAWRNGLVQ